MKFSTVKIYGFVCKFFRNSLFWKKNFLQRIKMISFQVEGKNVSLFMNLVSTNESRLSILKLLRINKKGDDFSSPLLNQISD
ncbi:hypothetical protein CH376_06070 [Leptospira adleri]|uniref:Uncharacterized protein n=1 Tax=Leptospira adleri TaxID=2023186 RepID=A0ABX4P189_9LEPT|nr:hypothetical protein CH376_06070 [Leptospira adleri]